MSDWKEALHKTEPALDEHGNPAEGYMYLTQYIPGPKEYAAAGFPPEHYEKAVSTLMAMTDAKHPRQAVVIPEAPPPSENIGKGRQRDAATNRVDPTKPPHQMDVAPDNWFSADHRSQCIHNWDNGRCRSCGVSR